MKKFLALLLALLMCVSVLASCGGNTDETAGATLDEAKELLNSMMKDKNGKATPSDYDVVAKLTVGTTVFEVTWKTDNENIKVKESSKAGFWTIDVPDVVEAEVEYKLTATIKDANGDTVEVSFTPKLPVVNNAGVATEFEAGTAYVMFMKQANLGYTVYALNTTQNGENKYIETTMDPKAAAVYYVEVVDGGYKIYTEIDGVKNYLHAELKTTGEGATAKTSKYIGLKADSTCVFTYDKELGVFKITLNGGEYGVGTYNAFETISLSDATYFKKDNINVEGGQFPVGLMTKAHADTLDPSQKPVNNDPKADSTLSIADAIALGDSKAKGMYTEGKYYVEGTVKEIQNDQYGNLVITDGTNDLLIYGTYSEDGATRFDKLATKPAVGDKIKVYGVIGKYNDAQMKDGWIIGAAAGEGSGDNTGDDTGSDFTDIIGTNVVTDLKAEVAYKIFFKQINKGATYFALNSTQENKNKFINATTDATAAATFYVEVVTGGYKFYTMINDVKNYVHATAVAKADGKGFTKSIGFATETDTVFTYDSAIGVYKVTIEGTEFGVGTYGTYETISLSEATYFKADNINVKDGQFAIGFVTAEFANTLGGTTDTPDTPDVPACTEHADANGDFVCDTADCGVVVELAADSVLTIPQANALGVALNGEYSANKYFVTGTIKDVYDIAYGNMHIVDENNVEFTVFGVNGYATMTNKPVAGDVITVYAAIGSYKGTAQMKNADMTDLKHTHAFENGECACGEADPNFVPTHTCEDGDDEDFVCDNADCDKAVLPADGTVLTIKQALAIGSLYGKNGYTTEKYVITGTIAQIKDASKGNIVISDGTDSIEIYGIKDANGVAFASLEKVPTVGDTFTLTGTVGMYNAAQMKNAVITGDITYHTHEYENGACKVCGATEPVAGATTIKVVAADAGYENAAEWGSYSADENITISGDIGSNSRDLPKYYTSGSAIRVYTGNTMTITAAEGYVIDSVVITTVSNYNITLETAFSAGTVAGVDTTTVTVTDINDSSLTLTNNKASGQFRIVSIEIVYKAA